METMEKPQQLQNGHAEPVDVEGDPARIASRMERSEEFEFFGKVIAPMVGEAIDRRIAQLANAATSEFAQLANAATSELALARKVAFEEAERAMYDRVYANSLPVVLGLTIGQQTPDAVRKAVEDSQITAQGIAERAVLKRRDSIARGFKTEASKTT